MIAGRCGLLTGAFPGAILLYWIQRMRWQKLTVFGGDGKECQ